MNVFQERVYNIKEEIYYVIKQPITSVVATTKYIITQHIIGANGNRVEILTQTKELNNLPFKYYISQNGNLFFTLMN